MVNLATPAPDIVAAILNESLPPELTLLDLVIYHPRKERQESEGCSPIIVAGMLPTLSAPYNDRSITTKRRKEGNICGNTCKTIMSGKTN